MSEEFATYNLITVIAERIIVNDFHLILRLGATVIGIGVLISSYQKVL